jgi:hypothetical protein
MHHDLQFTVGRRGLVLPQYLFGLLRIVALADDYGFSHDAYISFLL